MDVSELTLSAKGIMPVTDNVNVFAKLGGGVMRVMDSYSPAVVMGVGAGYSLTKNLQATLEFNGNVAPHSGTVGMATIGLTYHLG